MVKICIGIDTNVKLFSIHDTFLFVPLLIVEKGLRDRQTQIEYFNIILDIPIELTVIYISIFYVTSI